MSQSSTPFLSLAWSFGRKRVSNFLFPLLAGVFNRTFPAYRVSQGSKLPFPQSTLLPPPFFFFHPSDSFRASRRKRPTRQHQAGFPFSPPSCRSSLASQTPRTFFFTSLMHCWQIFNASLPSSLIDDHQVSLFPESSLQRKDVLLRGGNPPEAPPPLIPLKISLSFVGDFF